MNAEAIARALADLNPFITETGSEVSFCFFCGNTFSLQTGQPHSPDCLWRIAQDFKALP